MRGIAGVMIVASRISMKKAPATNNAIPLGNGARQGPVDDIAVTVVSSLSAPYVTGALPPGERRVTTPVSSCVPPVAARPD